MFKKLFSTPTASELSREAQRDIQKGSRDLDKEGMVLKRDEAKLILELKAAAKQGNQQSVQILAKSLIRLRAQMTKLQKGKATLGGVRTQIVTAAATANMAKTLGTATKTMSAMGEVMQPAKMQAQMREFSKQNAKMDMAQEFMGDALDDAFDTEDTEGETDDLVNQVLDEIGVDMSAAMGKAPSRAAKAQQAEAEEREAEAEEAALIARLTGLKS